MHATNLLLCSARTVCSVGWHRNRSSTVPGAGFEPYDPEVQTPHLNELIASGIELDRHYTFCFCSPSRSAFQSGRAPFRVNVENAEPSVWNKSDSQSGYAGIPVGMTTIATKMASAGYTTAMYGKW